jgi:hypothetical protein
MFKISAIVNVPTNLMLFVNKTVIVPIVIAGRHRCLRWRAAYQEYQAAGIAQAPWYMFIE